MEKLKFMKDYFTVYCQECGWSEGSKGQGKDLEKISYCEECGNTDLIRSTANEGYECICCDKCIEYNEDMWLTKSDEVVCDDCYSSGKYEESLNE